MAVTLDVTPLKGISPSFFRDARDSFIKAINILLEQSDLAADTTTVQEVVDVMNVILGDIELFDAVLDD